MRLIVDLFILFVRLLIFLGDLALLTIKIFLWAAKLVLHLVKKIQRKIFSKKSYFAKFRLPKIKIKKGKKPVVIFPLPLSTKARYFLLGLLFSTFFIFLPLLFIVYLQELPNPNALSGKNAPQTTKIYDRNGVLLYQIYATENRTLVPLKNIPKNLRDATVAIEDRDFYNHPGFDIKAILRSAVQNLSGRGLQGGSTITQQLVKSALLTPEASIVRKVKEVVLAFWAERIYSKNQILEMYFNQVPYGGTAWGVEAASLTYFGKKVSDLSLSESAFLAGIPKAPSIYSPFADGENLWKQRQIEVIRKMVEQGFITQKEGESAIKEELAFETQKTPIRAPHFVIYVKELLVKKYGLALVEKGGLVVKTSLDLSLQDKAQQIVAEEVEKNSYLNLTNGAALITNPSNGDILAMVGSRDYFGEKDGKVNVTTSLRQPGSSIKAVTYSAALSRGFTAATILDDSPITYKTPSGQIYSPVNYDGRFHGRVPLRIAFANSFNVPAVRTLNLIGIETMIRFGKDMGIKNWNREGSYGLSITLGGADVTMLDMATIYGTLSNGGRKVEVSPIISITDSKGDVLEEKRQTRGLRVIDEGVAYIISNILSDNSARAWEFGTSSPLVIPGHTVSVKTGTSDNKRDNWTIGYTPSYVVTVWVGNNDNSPMSQALASGITGAAPIWNRIMKHILAQKKDEKPKVPINIVQKPCGGRNEYFIRGTENIDCRPLAIPLFSPSPNP